MSLEKGLRKRDEMIIPVGTRAFWLGLMFFAFGFIILFNEFKRVGLDLSQNAILMLTLFLIGTAMIQIRKTRVIGRSSRSITSYLGWKVPFSGLHRYILQISNRSIENLEGISIRRTIVMGYEIYDVGLILNDKIFNVCSNSSYKPARRKAESILEFLRIEFGNLGIIEEKV